MGHKPWDRPWKQRDKARKRNIARAEMLDDMYDLIEVERRREADTGERHSLDDVIEELGITEEEIAAAD